MTNVENLSVPDFWYQFQHIVILLNSYEIEVKLMLFLLWPSSRKEEILN